MYAQQQHHRLKSSARRQDEGDNLWLSQNWGLVALAAIAVATMTVSAGTQTEPPKKPIREFPAVPHQTLFASVGSGITAMGGLPPAAAVQQQQQQQQQHPRTQESMVLRDLSWGRRVLQDTTEQPGVEYETQLELFICNSALETEGNDAYLVGTDELVKALSRVEGLNQVRFLEGSDWYWCRCAGLGFLGQRLVGVAWACFLAPDAIGNMTMNMSRESEI